MGEFSADFTTDMSRMRVSIQGGQGIFMLAF